VKHKSLNNYTKPGLYLPKRILYLAMCLFISFGTLTAQQEMTTTSGSNSTGGDPATSAQTGGSGFEVKSSFEIGVRGKRINGDENKYKSDLNYGAGLRFFDSSLLVTAKESDGKAFDTLLITGTGWNADPNGSVRVSMDKLGWYNFDGSVRRFTYFNNLSNFALGQHTRNTKRNIGDFDVTILPQNETIRFRFGYGFNSATGPAGFTYDFDRDEFPIKSNIDSRADDLRVGADGKLFGFNWSFTQGYRRFKNNTDFFIDTPQLGNNPNPRSSFTTFSRLIPENGTTHFSSFTTHRTWKERFDFTGRLVYSTSKSDFVMTEESTGIDRSGNIVLLSRSDVSGNAKRPNTIGDIGFTAWVTNKFRISNTFSFNSYRISGGNVLLELVRSTTAGGTPRPDVITSEGAYRFTNYRRFINTIEGDYDVNRFFSFYLGYRYTNRMVTLEGLDSDFGGPSTSGFVEDAENTTNSVLAGFKASPIPKKWTIFFDVEHGQSDNAFTRLGNYDTTNLRVRSRIKPTNEFALNLSAQWKDNTNPAQTDTTPPTSFNAESDAKSFGGSFDWTPDPRASISGGYSHNRVKSLAAVIFPVSGTGIGQGLSRYTLRNHFFNLDGWFNPYKVVSFFVSYRISKDTGSGDFFSAANYLIEGNYPVSYQSPEARLTFRLHDRVDWNLGYQFYNYNEMIPNNQNYRAHLPYTSLRIYLGRSDR